MLYKASNGQYEQVEREKGEGENNTYKSNGDVPWVVFLL
jgi:hypothetical protein